MDNPADTQSTAAPLARQNQERRATPSCPDQTAAEQGQPEREPAPAFLAGGGEMGALARAMDWSTTAVGPAERWPQSLKTAVSICLGSRHPMVVWWGRSAYTQFYNDAYISFLGRAKHPGFLGRSGRDCWREIWPVIGPMLEGVYATGEATWSEDLLLILDRNLPLEEAYFTFSYSPIHDDNGGIGGIFCACNETTARVIGERRLRTLRDLNLMEAEARTAAAACRVATRILGDNPADIPFAFIYLIDANGKEAELVAATAVAPGPGAPERIDLNEGGATSRWPLAQVLQAGAAQLVSDIPSKFGPLRGGQWPEPCQTARITAFAAPGQGRPTGFLVAGLSSRRVIDEDYESFLDLVAGHIGTSVANARAYEEERRRAEALAEIDRAKTAFFSNVSHEFRTPLTLMLGPLEEALTASAEPLAPTLRKRLNLVQRNGLRLQKLVNALLDFSRVEAGRIRAAYLPTDLASLTRDLASSFRSACEKAGLDLVIDAPPLPETVFVDQEMWEKIVLNLVSNAFKFTLRGSIRVALAAEGGNAALRVCDTGTGIPEAELPRIFERFHRVEGALGRTYEGTGIGLALVQELVRLHKGEVTVESSLGQGTTFTVRVPLGNAHLPQDRIGGGRSQASTATRAEAFVNEALRWLPDEILADGASPDAEPPPSAPGAARASILIADDNADMREYLCRLLERRYDVRAVADGEAALAALSDDTADLLLSDVMMPRLDGFGLLRAVRANPALAELPVVLLSARAGEEASVEGLESGANDYLVKPFGTRELLARIASNLELARIRGQSRKTEDRLRAIFETTPECIKIVGRDGTLLHMNPAGLGMVEAGEAALVEGRCTFDLIAPEDRARWRAFHEGVCNGEKLSCQFDIVGLHGTRRHMETHAAPLPMPDGTMAQLAITRDITQRKRDETALRELNETLERRVEERTRALEAAVAGRRRLETIVQQTQHLESIGQLTGGVAHDFNNLLTVIMGQTENIIRAAAGNERIVRMATTAQQIAERGAQLTSQLLAFARRQRLRPQPVVLHRLMAATGDLVKRAIGESVTVEIGTSPDLWPALVDPAQFESAVVNLAINARDAMPDGGRLTIDIRNAVLSAGQAERLDVSLGDYVVVAVSDTGHGMAEDVQRRCFEPFFTTKDVGKGTGLGLSQVYGFARQSGGTAAVFSAIGRGTTIAMYLPRTTEKPIEKTSAQYDRAAPSGQGQVVLIVEDEREVREIIELSLAELGYRVLVAPDGIEARKILEGREDVDLLLTDVVMPNRLDGFELARWARRKRQELKIVLVSGYSRQMHSRGNNDDGFVFLEKPFRPRELAKAIATALRNG